MERHQENSNQEGPMNDPMAGLMTRMVRSHGSTMVEEIFNVISTNFEWITGLISQGGQFMWNIILQACYLLMEVFRQSSLSVVNICFDGGENRFQLLKESLKEAGKKILNIGQAVRQIFMNYWVSNQEALDLNVDLQDVLHPNMNLQETEAVEELLNQSSSGRRTPNEESDISLD